MNGSIKQIFSVILVVCRKIASAIVASVLFINRMIAALSPESKVYTARLARPDEL